MPIYEYRCTSCNTNFEKLMKFGDAAPQCPDCGAGEARKMVSASGFILKGRGWFRDGYGLKAGEGKNES